MFVQKISRNNYRDTYNLKKIILIADIENFALPATDMVYQYTSKKTLKCT